jgi:hypothetical protein
MRCESRADLSVGTAVLRPRKHPRSPMRRLSLMVRWMSEDVNFTGATLPRTYKEGYETDTPEP